MVPIWPLDKFREDLRFGSLLAPCIGWKRCRFSGLFVRTVELLVLVRLNALLEVGTSASCWL